MKCSMVLLAPFLLLLTSEARKLSAKENDQLQKSCGVNMKEVYRTARKVLNGTAAHSGESPWTAAVYFSDDTKTTYTTGTLISNRHVLTYDRMFVYNSSNVIKFRHNRKPINESDYKCEGDNMVLSEELVKKVYVVFDTLRADRLGSKHRANVKKISIVKGCLKPYVVGKVTVLEMRDTIETKKPICIAGSGSMPSYTFYGFGDNRNNVIDARLRHTNITTVPCEDPSRTDIFCVKAKQALCNGDFGGAAIRKINGRIQIFGVYVDGLYDCSQADENQTAVFANLTSFSRSICEISGVCGLGSNATDGSQTTTGSDDHDGGVSGGGVTDVVVNGRNSTCDGENDDDDVIHVDIHLGKFKKTGDMSDIKTVIRGAKD